jgi:predicted phage tail protein
VVSTAATAPAPGPPVGPVVGASAIAAAAVRVAVRDDLTIAASSCSAVATLRGSAGISMSMGGISRQLGSSTVAAEVSNATCGFVVAVPGGGGWVTLLSTRMK